MCTYTQNRCFGFHHSISLYRYGLSFSVSIETINLIQMKLSINERKIQKPMKGCEIVLVEGKKKKREMEFESDKYPTRLNNTNKTIQWYTYYI